MNPHRACHRFKVMMIFFFLGVVALFALAVFGLWNAILPAVLGVKAITYWQALGILVLTKILFGGFPRRGHDHFAHFMMRKRWEKMTPEQREELRESMRHRFGDWPRPPWHDEKQPQPGPQNP